MVHRRQFLKAAGAGLAMPALTRAAGAQTPEVTLRMHHFLPAVIEWACQISEALGRQGHG